MLYLFFIAYLVPHVAVMSDLRVIVQLVELYNELYRGCPLETFNQERYDRKLFDTPSLLTRGKPKEDCGLVETNIFILFLYDNDKLHQNKLFFSL